MCVSLNKWSHLPFDKLLRMWCSFVFILHVYGKTRYFGDHILLIPAISVPVGFCKEGFLLRLQVIGRWMDEVAMMKVARAIELIINSCKYQYFVTYLN